MSNVDRDLAQALLAKVVLAHCEDLCMAGINLAELGGAISATYARAGESSNSRSVLVLLCGPIPDDLVQALGQYTAALAQDLKTDGKIRLIHEG